MLIEYFVYGDGCGEEQTLAERSWTVPVVHTNKWPFLHPNKKGEKSNPPTSAKAKERRGINDWKSISERCVLFSQSCPPMIVLQMIGSERVSNAHVKRLVLTVIAHVRRVYTGAPARVQKEAFKVLLQASFLDDGNVIQEHIQ